MTHNIRGTKSSIVLQLLQENTEFLQQAAGRI